MKFEYMLQILFTLKFLGVRYIVITLYFSVILFRTPAQSFAYAFRVGKLR